MKRTEIVLSDANGDPVVKKYSPELLIQVEIKNLIAHLLYCSSEHERQEETIERLMAEINATMISDRYEESKDAINMALIVLSNVLSTKLPIRE